MTTDPAVFDRIVADDWVNLNPTRIGPNQATILERYRERAGHAPPYVAKEEDLQIYLLGETAVAAYIKVYTANENHNVASHDTTDIFIKTSGIWKLRISRTSPHAEQP